MVNPFSSFSISNSKGEEKRNASVFIVSSCSWICFDTRLARFIGCKKTRLKTGSVNGWKCRPLIFCWNWWRPHGLMRVAKKNASPVRIEFSCMQWLPKAEWDFSLWHKERLLAIQANAGQWWWWWTKRGLLHCAFGLMGRYQLCVAEVDC